MQSSEHNSMAGLVRMTEWLRLERLENNDLPIPKYETLFSAGVDFPACLTRPQRLVPEGARYENTRPFYQLTSGVRAFTQDEQLEYDQGILYGKDPIPTEPTCNPHVLSKTPCEVDHSENSNKYLVDLRQRPVYHPSFELSIYPRETVMVSLGCKCQFGGAYVLMLHIRSSIGMMGLQLANNTGIIDPDYRGELWAVLHNRSRNKTIKIRHGDRLVQGVMLRFNQAIIEEGPVEQTQRGDGGFGSTGISTPAHGCDER